MSLDLYSEQGQIKPASQTANPNQTGSKAVKILGPFLSREDLDEYTKVVLKNGLSVILFERRDVPLVCISTYVKAGYLNEPDSLRGISHVMEHMFFKGTPQRGVGQIAKETKGLGGLLNAETSYEHTRYYTVLPSDQFRQGLQIQADALQNPLISEDELKKEIQVVLQEAKRKLDSPTAFSLEKLYELAFDVSPVRRWRIGDESTLLPLARKDVLDFHRRWYVPSNIILVISGNIDRRQVLDELVKRYSAMAPEHVVPPTIPVEAVQKTLKYRQLRGDIHEARVEMGFQAPPAFSKDWHACRVLQAVLTLGRNSVLNRELKEAKGLVHSVTSSYLELKGEGYVSIGLDLDASKINPAELAAFTEFERMKSGALEEADIERAENLLEREFYLDEEDLTGLSIQLAHFENFANYGEWRNSVKRMRAVTSEQVIQAARKYFTLTRCSILEYLPNAASSRSVTAEGLAAFINQALPVSVRTAEEEEPAEKVSQNEKGRSPRTPAKRVKLSNELSTAWVEYPLTQYTILRGPEVLVKESHALPIISLGIFFPGGRIFEGKANNGITELMLRTSIKGTLTWDAIRLSSFFERQGARVEARSEPDFFGYMITGLSMNFEKNLDRLIAIIKQPRFDEEEIKKEKEQLKAEAARVADNNMLYSQQLFKQAAYGDHPYGLPAFGRPESIENITRADLQEWHSQFVKNSQPFVVIAGDTEGSDYASRLSNQFNGSEVSIVDLKLAAPLRKIDSPREKVETRDRRQSSSVIGFLGPPAMAPESMALTVLKNMVSGLGGRFFEEIRDKQALAYTVSATHEPTALGGSFYSYVATSPENRKLALDALKEQFRKLKSEPIPEEELRRAKSYSLGIYFVRLQRREEQVLEFARMKAFGLGVDEIRDYPDQIRQIGPELVHESAVKFFDLERYAVGGVEGTFSNATPRGK